MLNSQAVLSKLKLFFQNSSVSLKLKLFFHNSSCFFPDQVVSSKPKLFFGAPGCWATAGRGRPRCSATPPRPRQRPAAAPSPRRPPPPPPSRRGQQARVQGGRQRLDVHPDADEHQLLAAVPDPGRKSFWMSATLDGSVGHASLQDVGGISVVLFPRGFWSLFKIMIIPL